MTPFSESGRAAVLIFFLTAVVYCPVFNAGFIWDDDAFLTANDLITSPDGLFRIWFTTEAPDYFPLVSTSLWLEWRVWGPNPSGYHIVNVALHALGSFLLYLVLTESGVRGALFAALLFALHPVNVESVAWITERKNTLPLPLYFSSILFFLRFQRSGDYSVYFISLLLFFLSLLAKTSVVMLPFVLLGIVLCRRGWFKTGIRDARALLPFFMLSLIMGLVTLWFQYNRAIGDEIIREDGFVSRLATAAAAVWFYLYKAFLPLNLVFVYPGRSFPDAYPAMFFPLIALLFCMALLWHYRGTWSRPVLYGFAYFTVTLFPVLGFFNIYFMKFSLVADHWQYFALAGPVTLAAFLSSGLFERSEGRRRGSLLAVGVLVILLSGALSFSRAGVYKNRLSLYNDTISKNQECWMAYNNRGHVHDVNGETQKALLDFNRAIELKPDYAEAYFNRGILLGRAGDWEKAVDDYTLAVKYKRGFAGAYYNRGILYLENGMNRAAYRDFGRTVALDPGFFRAYIRRGALLAKQGSYWKAIDDFNRAIDLEPENSKSYVNRGAVYAMSGDLSRAVMDFTTAIGLNKDEVSAYVNRAFARKELGYYDLAAGDMNTAVKLGHTPDKDFFIGLAELTAKRRAGN